MADFPRGGSSALTPLEVRKIRQDAEKDVLFGSTGDTKKKKRTKQPKSLKSFEKKQESTVLLQPTTKSVEPLMFKSLSEGMLVLGCVREIQMTELVVSLPNSLSGFVPISNISEHFSKQLEKNLMEETEVDTPEEDDDQLDLQNIFYVGQFIPAVIKNLDSSKHGYKKIMLSVDPKEVNKSLTGANLRSNMVLWGCVSSVEDHGCIVSFGMKDINGFISKENGGHLKCGYLQWFLVKECKAKGRVATLSCDKDEIKKAKITEESHTVFSSLVPGALVNATVLKSSGDGVIVKFSGFEGIIDGLHLPDHGADAENKIKEKKKIKCRIIHVNPATKTIGLSATQQLISLESDEKSDTLIGEIQECTIIGGDPNVLLLVDLPSCNRKGFVHISRLSDARVEKLGKKFKAGTVHICRIIGFNGLDGLFVVTFQKSVIEQPFLRHVDIKPGALVSGTVVTLEEFGMLVKVSNNIKGLCPRIHLADINLKHPEKKFTEGKKVRCKVLDVNPEKKRLTLTHKKTLVDSELPIFTSYDGLKRGMQTHGFIQFINDHGLIIRFYNNVKGFAPKKMLGLQSDEAVKDVFFIGQVVKCTVLSCNPENRRLSLSLQSNLSQNDGAASLNRGDIVSGKVLKTSSTGLDLQLSNEQAAFLPKEHFSDFKCNHDPLLFVYQTGREVFGSIDDLVYLGERRKRHTLSKKKLLKLSVETNRLITKFEQIKVGMQAIGFVHSIMPYGVFIEFAPGIMGLAPNSNLADYYISDASSHFCMGQTVIAKVAEIDEERKRLLVAIKPSMNEIQKSDELTSRLSSESLLRSLLDEREDIFLKLSGLQDGPIKHLSGLVGKVIQAKVMSVKSDGVRLQTEDGSNGYVPSSLRKGIDVETGDVMSCFVVDVDTSNWLFIAKLLSEDSLSDKMKNSAKVKVGQEVETTVEYITNEYIVTSFPSKDRQVIGYLAAKDHLNDVRDVSKRYFIGQKVRANIHSKTSSGVILSNEDSFEDGKPSVGSMVTATVKSVKALQVNVSLKNTNLHGRIHISEIWDDAKEGMCPFDEFRPGESVRCKLIAFRDAKSHNYLPITHQQSSKVLVDLSLKPSHINDNSISKIQEPKPIGEYKKGETVVCFVKGVSENFLTVIVSEKVSGKVSLMNSSTDKKVLRHMTSHFKHGTSYKATILNVDSNNNSLDLSFIGNPSDQIKKDGVVYGKIVKILPHTGLMIELPGHKCGIAHLTQLHDEYTENPLEEFKLKMIVRCCILSIKDQDHIDLSLRSSRVSQEQSESLEVKDRSILSLDDLHENDILRGYVKSCTKCGLFVGLSSKIVGRVQIKNLSKYFLKNWEELFPVGKLVKAKILSIDPNNNHIELSLRGPDVKDKDPGPPPPKRSRKESDASEPRAKLKRKNSEELASDDEEIGNLGESDDESESEEEMVDTSSSSKQVTELPRLSLSTGFDWSESDAEDSKKRKIESDSESESEEETDQISVKKTKRQKRAAKKEEEEYLHKTELALLDKNRGPENADDFDRLTRTSPNSSIIWIQYMAFYLHSAEVDKARSVAQRALKTISFREEQEKFNVWVAFLNLENLYGTDESLQNIFNEAVRQNDAKKIYLKMVDIYAHNNKPEKAEKLYQTMTRRFNTSKKVWVSYGFFLMKNGKAEAARKLLQRSFQSLPNRKHINAILKFAIMEFRFGDSQKGVTMFESVLKNHPKRTDIWSVYIDMMIKQDETEAVRNIFERIITLNLSTKKMKFIFKRYLEFEKKQGDEQLVEGVKTKARSFVESKVASA